MNRRSLLKLLGLAPLAAPAASAMPARMASGGYVGLSETLMPLRPMSVVISDEIHEIRAMPFRLDLTIASRSPGFVDGDGI